MGGRFGGNVLGGKVCVFVAFTSFRGHFRVKLLKKEHNFHQSITNGSSYSGY